MASLALVALVAAGGVSVYYAFATRADGGLSYTGFTVTLTRSTSTFAVPKGDVLVTIPYGVNTNSHLSFEPLNLRLVLGVNSTIYFYNEDTTEHIIESLQWPGGSTGFDVFLIQGKTATLQLNTTGVYLYNFELTPAGENGTITVVSR